MQTSLLDLLEDAPEATLFTPCSRCGRVSPGGNWVRNDGHEALCDGAFLDGRCDAENGTDFGAE